LKQKLKVTGGSMVGKNLQFIANILVASVIGVPGKLAM
jgi:hypothetical protein